MDATTKVSNIPIPDTKTEVVISALLVLTSESIVWPIGVNLIILIPNSFSITNCATRSDTRNVTTLIRVRDVAEMIGYCKEQVGEWANEGLIQYVTISNIRYVSKSNLIHFLCTEDFDSVSEVSSGR
ncbi:MAG: hypothetical protein MJ084_04860 [Saccharofermentans sp.]|nr:hypothetical protein [Saccharofermentans sp.]